MSRRRSSLAAVPSIPEVGAFQRATSKRWCSTVCARSSRLTRKSVTPSRRSTLTPRPNAAVLDRSAKLAERWTTLASLELRELVYSLVQQIQIGEAQILVWLNRTALVLRVMPGASAKATDSDYMPSIEPFVLSITASLRRAGKGVRMVIGNGAAMAIDSGLTSLIARAMATRNMFLAGRDDSIDAMAARLGVRRDYLAVLVRLSYLSPEIVRAILVGQQPIELTPTRLVALSRNLPHDWQEQGRLLGFTSA